MPYYAPMFPMGMPQGQQPYFSPMQYPRPFQWPQVSGVGWTTPPVYGQSIYGGGGRGGGRMGGISHVTQQLSETPARNVSPQLFQIPPTMPGVPPTRVKYTSLARNHLSLQAPGSQSPSADIPGSGAMQGISLSGLTAMGQQEQKQLLGERLYLSVMTIDPLFHDMDLVGKITGMLLEMNNVDILHLLESPDGLHKKVQEAIAVLEANQQKDSTTSQLSAAAMAPPSRSVQHTAVARNRTTLQAPGRQLLSADIPGSGAMQGISLSDLTGMPHHEQKQLLGERLFRRVINIDPQFHDMDLAGKITGMLLEMDNADILHLLESQDALREKVQEALDVILAHEQLESTTSELSAAAMAPPFKTVKYSSVVRNHPALQAHKQKESTTNQLCAAGMAGYPQDYADLTFHFVEKPPEWLLCAVCQSVALDPVQANCCGKIYCARCIERWKKKSNSCPTCRSTKQSSPPFNVFQDRNAHQHITSLVVYCPNQCDGCSKTVELSQLENHLTSDNSCLFQVVECGNKCGRSMQRLRISEHMTTECHLRNEKCRYCPLVSTHEHVTGAHLGECPNYPLDQAVNLQKQEVQESQEMDELTEKVDKVAL